MMAIGLLSKEITFVIILVLFGTIESYKLENIALNKKAYQTTDNYADTGFADRAVDGDLSQHVVSGICTHTKSEANAYWEVDLGKKLFIDHVTIYKRTHLHDDTRLKDVELYIGLLTDNYKLVGYHDGVMGSVYTFNLTKQVIGQWVRITRVPSATKPLELCEVQVFGHAAGWFFRKYHDQKGIHTSIQTSVNSPTITHCGFVCYTASGCEAANYDEDMQKCDLLTSTSNETAPGQSMIVLMNN